jgi:hypothetical protein
VKRSIAGRKSGGPSFARWLCASARLGQPQVKRRPATEAGGKREVPIGRMCRELLAMPEPQGSKQGTQPVGWEGTWAEPPHVQSMTGRALLRLIWDKDAKANLIPRRPR